MVIEINDKLYGDIQQYCQLNGFDIVDVVNKILKKGFMVEKYGDKPNINQNVVVEEKNDVVKSESNVNVESLVIEKNDEPEVDDEVEVKEIKKVVKRKINIK